MHFGDRQTDGQTNRWTNPMHKGALAVVSGVLTSKQAINHLSGSVGLQRQQKRIKQ